MVGALRIRARRGRLRLQIVQQTVQFFGNCLVAFDRWEFAAELALQDGKAHATSRSHIVIVAYFAARCTVLCRNAIVLTGWIFAVVDLNSIYCCGYPRCLN